MDGLMVISWNSGWFKMIESKINGDLILFKQFENMKTRLKLLSRVLFEMRCDIKLRNRLAQ